MNIKNHSETLNIKKQELSDELMKPEEEQNKFKIKRLKESIKRNKNIARSINHKRKKAKIR